MTPVVWVFSLSRAAASRMRELSPPPLIGQKFRGGRGHVAACSVRGGVVSVQVARVLIPPQVCKKEQIKCLLYTTDSVELHFQRQET